MPANSEDNEQGVEDNYSEEELQQLLREQMRQEQQRDEELRAEVRKCLGKLVPQYEKPVTFRELVDDCFKPGWRAPGMFEASDHQIVTLEEKFAAILAKDYEDAVVSFGRTLSGKPAKWAPRVRRLHKRHEEKRQRATMLLADSGFLDDLFAMVSRWGLDTHLFSTDAFEAFYQAPVVRALTIWSEFLRNASAKCWFDNHKRIRKAHQRLADKYAADLSIGALLYGMNLIEGGLPSTRFNSEVRALTSQYGLSGLWEQTVALLLLSGRCYVPYQDCRIVLQSDSVGSRLFFEVFPETRKQDLGDKWSGHRWLIESLFPGHPKRRKAHPQFDRDRETSMALDGGRNLDEIVVCGYDLDESMGQGTPTLAVSRRENLLKEALRSGAKRFSKAQGRSSSAHAQPVTEAQLDRFAKMRGRWATEWHL